MAAGRRKQQRRASSAVETTALRRMNNRAYAGIVRFGGALEIPPLTRYERLAGHGEAERDVAWLGP
jgi:hypothetical protein